MALPSRAPLFDLGLVVGDFTLNVVEIFEHKTPSLADLTWLGLACDCRRKMMGASATICIGGCRLVFENDSALMIESTEETLKGLSGDGAGGRGLS
jgi:hypothetical protein